MTSQITKFPRLKKILGKDYDRVTIEVRGVVSQIRIAPEDGEDGQEVIHRISTARLQNALGDGGVQINSGIDGLLGYFLIGSPAPTKVDAPKVESAVPTAHPDFEAAKGRVVKIAVDGATYQFQAGGMASHVLPSKVEYLTNGRVQFACGLTAYAVLAIQSSDNAVVAAGVFGPKSGVVWSHEPRFCEAIGLTPAEALPMTYQPTSETPPTFTASPIEDDPALLSDEPVKTPTDPALIRADQAERGKVYLTPKNVLVRVGEPVMRGTKGEMRIQVENVVTGKELTIPADYLLQITTGIVDAPEPPKVVRAPKEPRARDPRLEEPGHRYTRKYQDVVFEMVETDSGFQVWRDGEPWFGPDHDPAKGQPAFRTPSGAAASIIGGTVNGFQWWNGFRLVDRDGNPILAPTKAPRARSLEKATADLEKAAAKLARLVEATQAADAAHTALAAEVATLEEAQRLEATPNMD